MESGIAAFDPNDLISYSPEESEDEGEPPPEPEESSPEVAAPQDKPAEASTAIDLAAISGEEIQLTVPSVSVGTAAAGQVRNPLDGARFKCKFCPTFTTTAEDFIKHFIMHFGRNRISYKQMSQEEARALPNACEKFVCGICARCFETRDDVKDHMIKDHGFKEAKPKEPVEAPPMSAPVTPGVKRKLDDDFVDSQKLKLSGDSSSSSDEETKENKVPPTKSSVAVVPQSSVPEATVATTATAAVVVSPAAPPVVVCDSETPKTPSATQSPATGVQPHPVPTAVNAGPVVPAVTAQPPKLAEGEDAELNEYLQPMTLKTLKLRLLAGLRLKCPQKGCVYKFETRAKRDIHLKCHNVEPALIGPGGPVPGVAPATGTAKEEKKDNFKCYQCGLEFPRWRECCQHLWKQHQIDVNMLKCPVCDVRFEFAVKVYRHLQTHRPVKAYSCTSCGKSFATHSQLLVHESLHKKQQMQRAKLKAAATKEASVDKDGKAVDGDTEGGGIGDDEAEEEANADGEGKAKAEKLPWYAERKCDICGHMFGTSKILSKHIKTVHHKIKPFICSVCGYKSARKVTLTIHMRQHSGQKPLECKECPFRTADPSTLKHHEKRHTKDKWYECKFCGLLTIQAGGLKAHIRLNHPKEYETMKCDLCNFTSVNPELLARHKSDHKAGLIKSEDSHDSVSSKRSKNAPESSSDCFLPIESTDSVVHDAGGFTIPAVINAPVAHSEETQFPT